jgi:preprotein translocase subunit Sec61beta
MLTKFGGVPSPLDHQASCLVIALYARMLGRLWFNWIMVTRVKRFPVHGWTGVGLVIVFWTLNWSLTGLRTQWAFFPLWVGFCLTVDALVFWRTGTSLFFRNRWKYVGLFIASAPVWWLFELANWRLQNWQYIGAESFSTLQFWFWATLNFTTVIPAVFGSAELVRSFLPEKVRGPIIRPTIAVTVGFFVTGWAMLALMIAWPGIFFPFIWFSLYFLLEPINIWLGHRTLVEWTKSGNWQPVFSLWLGVLMTAFFWEMWNYLSFPKWVYHVPWGNWFHIFEMPMLGYGGYLPFALELFALYHLLAGFWQGKKTEYVVKLPEK